MYLIINTTNNQFIELILAKDENDFKVKKISAELKQSEKLLPAITAFLKQNKVKLSQLRGIGVVSGPGGFTSLRIGMVTANTLAYALKIPAVGLENSEFKNPAELVEKVIKKINRSGKFVLSKNIVLPTYGAEPNITISKK